MYCSFCGLSIIHTHVQHAFYDWPFVYIDFIYELAKYFILFFIVNKKLFKIQIIFFDISIFFMY